MHTSSYNNMALSHDTIFESITRNSSSSKKCENISVSCFCPCLILGHIQSKIKREKMWNFTQKPWFPSITQFSEDDSSNAEKTEKDYRMQLGFGSSGCIICMQTAFLAAFGLPCSPLLSLYVCCQRSYFRKIYHKRATDVPNTFTPHCSNICFDTLGSCCCLPLVLLQHLNFLEIKSNQGVLFFDWEKGAYEDLRSKKILPPRRNRIALIIGSKDSGKSTLFCKLLGIKKDPTRESLRDQNKIQTGVRCASVTDNEISFHEFWDVPTAQVNSSAVNTVMLTVSSVIFMFDSSNTDKMDNKRDKKKKEIKKKNKTVTEDFDGFLIENNSEDILLSSSSNDDNDDSIDKDTGPEKYGGSSFDEMKTIYYDFTYSHKKLLQDRNIQMLCVAGRLDLLEAVKKKRDQSKGYQRQEKYEVKHETGDHDDDDDDGDNVDDNDNDNNNNNDNNNTNDNNINQEKQQDKNHYHTIAEERRGQQLLFDEAETWSSQNNLTFIETSSTANIGVLELLRQFRNREP